jgi:glutathione peroxidase-family protein
MAGAEIAWNFHKFLIDSDGQVKFSYDPQTHPLDLKGDIESMIY